MLLVKGLCQDDQRENLVIWFITNNEPFNENLNSQYDIPVITNNNSMYWYASYVIVYIPKFTVPLNYKRWHQVNNITAIPLNI